MQKHTLDLFLPVFCHYMCWAAEQRTSIWPLPKIIYSRSERQESNTRAWQTAGEHDDALLNQDTVSHNIKWKKETIICGRPENVDILVNFYRSKMKFKHLREKALFIRNHNKNKRWLSSSIVFLNFQTSHLATRAIWAVKGYTQDLT